VSLRRPAWRMRVVGGSLGILRIPFICVPCALSACAIPAATAPHSRLQSPRGPISGDIVNVQEKYSY
jgi:hypothetical protein